MVKAPEENSDGLEIISIGKLYNDGPWEKKYWSCSRGKDRYPYPVAFKAVRTQNGITYRMEIFEGHKGPLFMVSSTDGVSSSGQTPDIACESFQKKGSSQIKLLRGKRFSCKIDGLEFFGFKNPFVQRLLRQLVANIDGPAEQGFDHSAVVNEAVGIEDPVQQTDLSIPSDLLPYKEKPRVTLNRSRKEKLFNIALGSSTSLNKVHSQHRDHNALSSQNGLSCQEIPSNCDLTKRISREDDEFIECVGAGQKLENLQPEIGKNLLLSSQNDSHLNFYDASHNFMLESTSAQEESKLASCGGTSALETNVTSTKRKEHFDCSVTKIEDEDVKEESNIETADDLELCAPDTFDDQEGKVTVTNTAASKVLVTETHPEDNAYTSNSYPSSEKPDSDSADQDIAKSMMAVLLPQAIPLLKTFSRKKKNKKSLESSTSISIEETNVINDDQSPGRGTKETMGLSLSNGQPHVHDVSYENMENLEHVILDSFDNDENNNPLKKKLPLFHDVQMADQLLVVPDTYQSEGFLDAQSEAPDCPIEATHGGSSFPADSCIGNSATSLMKELPDDNNLADFDMSTLPAQVRKLISSDEMVHKEEGECGPNLNKHTKKEKKNELEDMLKLVACYDHPMPVSMILLNTVGNKIYLCVLCVSPLQGDTIIFVYKTPISGEGIGSPSFVGYSPAILPSSKDAFGRMISVDSSGLQFVPNAQSLVLLNSIRVACCREGNIYCTCQACSSCCLQENAIQIVRVEVGFVSVVTRLKTTQAVRCILVCEPNYLVAADESGRLYLWVMNSSWSAQIEECYLPAPEVMFSCIVELRKIPACDAYIVGHDGHGDFNLWDINRRILMSKFSMPSTYITKCVPISLFEWQRDSRLSTDLKPEEFASEVLDATRKNRIPQTNEHEDVAIWLLVSTMKDSEFEDSDQPVDGQIYPVECWRLALLIKEMVILGTYLDAKAGVVGVSDGNGIMGRKDGLVYLWELSTGTKLGMLHQFKGSGVSYIATDSCNMGTLAIASDSGQLRVYKSF